MFNCKICNKEFKSYQAVASHQSFHKIINEACDICGKEFTSQHALNGHKVWHNKSHQERIEKINSKTTEKHKEAVSEYMKNPIFCKNCSIVLNYKQYIFRKNRIGKNGSPRDVFCGQSCAGFYTAKNKTHGYRRSKLEIEIEKIITEKYPHLEVDYNKKNTILSELDIYIPRLKLAFELNGIFHYEPIYGKDCLEKIQSNDNRKILACAEKEIELCVIDSSGLKSMTKKEEVTKYLNIVTSIIDQKMARLNYTNGL